jgi:hypothetical protein
MESSPPDPALTLFLISCFYASGHETRNGTEVNRFQRPCNLSRVDRLDLLSNWLIGTNQCKSQSWQAFRLLTQLPPETVSDSVSSFQTQSYLSAPIGEAPWGFWKAVMLASDGPFRSLSGWERSNAGARPVQSRCKASARRRWTGVGPALNRQRLRAGSALCGWSKRMEGSKAPASAWRV